MADNENNTAVTIDPQQLDGFGNRLFTKFGQYKTDRKPLEEQFVKNLRQYRGVYDPEIESIIPKDRSRAYPKVTRKKVINTVSRLMEMLFPQTEKNYGLSPTPMPDLTVEDMQKLLDSIQIPADGTPLDDAQIDAAIKEIAQARCERLETTIDDQLLELDWVSIARKVIFSGVLYGAGIVKGPLVRNKMQTKWRMDPVRKKPIAYAIEKMFPYFEFMSVWAYYPDLSAKTREQQDDYFERHVMSRQQVEDLAKRPDFIESRVREFLAANSTGNFTEEWWETLLRTGGDKSNTANTAQRKYMGLEYWGYARGEELAAAGANIPVEDSAKLFECSVFMLGSKVVKATVNPYKSKRRPDHVFVYEDDDINLMGSGLPPVVRDSQMAICEAARMALDNGSAVCGPILEMNVDLLTPGQDLSIHAYKTFLREDENRAGVPAVREVKVESHIPELQGLIELFMGFADDETALPPAATGDVSQGGSEALRTQGNMSMILSAAALPIRDTVRNFDMFTESAIGGLVDWNMQFNDDPGIKGDFVVLARGSTSLIAKEVRSQQMDSFKATLDDEERLYIKTGKFVRERAKARDLPEDIMEDDAVVKQKLDARAAEAQKQSQLNESMVESKVKEAMARTFKLIADAGAAETDSHTASFAAIMKAVTDANKPQPGDRKAA